MIALLQRVREAEVTIEGIRQGAIDAGILALLGLQAKDTAESVTRLLDKILNYRIFDDDAGKMNRSLVESHGGLLLVPQFTLTADTTRGLRPSLSGGAPPTQGRQLFDLAVATARNRHDQVASGVFGAHMQVSLINDGPVTFWLQN